MNKDILFATVAALAFSVVPANAAVRYDFEAFSSFPLGTPSDIVTGRFSLTLADFVTSSKTVALADLTSCSAMGSVSGALPCDKQILTVGGGFDDYVLFGLVQPDGPANVAYYFAPGALSAAGIYDSTLFGKDQAGRLTVTVLGGAVPEPASWAMMIAGFGLVGASMRRRVAKVSYA